MENLLRQRQLRRLYSLTDQRVDSHRANTAWNRGNRRNAIFQADFFDITDTTWVVTRVYHYSTVFNPVSFDQLWFTHCAYNDIRTLDLFRQVLAARVQDGYGGVSVQQHGGHWLTKNRAAANYNSVLTFLSP